jgi:3-isopropylmalate dehydrogenase
VATRVRVGESEYPEIEAKHMYIDALAMFMVQDPGQFDVIVTNNLFGDIITDIGGALQGGLGMAASGNLHPGRTSMFEPVHGRRRPWPGRTSRTRSGAISRRRLLLETLGATRTPRRIERAVEGRSRAGGHTRRRRIARDTEAGDAILRRLQVNQESANHESGIVNRES